MQASGHLANAWRLRNDLLAIQLQQTTAGALQAIRAQPKKACTPIQTTDIREGTSKRYMNPIELNGCIMLIIRLPRVPSKPRN